ncbi:MAG TPA: MFS transporter, partial [Lachnospiraceae bacterium]|nr:MFS transporter [Lachnospiraceae bacterium]
MKRWFYAVIGVIILLLAGMVYAWSVMAKTISAAHPEWSATALSLTFTLVMALFCIGCLLAGILAKRIKARIYILLAGVLFLAGFFLASLTGASILPLYLGFGILCGIA